MVIALLLIQRRQLTIPCFAANCKESASVAALHHPVAERRGTVGGNLGRPEIMAMLAAENRGWALEAVIVAADDLELNADRVRIGVGDGEQLLAPPFAAAP